MLANPFTIKYDIPLTVKSISITCDQEYIIFGAMRKILFKRVQSIFDISQKMSKSKLKKDNMHSLGKLSTASNLEVSQIECHPELPQVVASTSGNNVLVWDLQSPEQ